ncbi:TetR/AcrR family transcriptional regulator [Nonomuraea mesophila]|uniref:TetR/AcrR family transcriptional regulator n=1 Tax=Nonomuraea mesophila TaxID=2530382 RepID=A0A4R5FJC3_9ACTN|nr:TetR/AcrR family transcriptional regulator [Nonomuraea mesophila]
MRAILSFRYSYWRPVLTPRKHPRQQRSRETVAAILEAAAQLFQRHGYTATTTNKIAERAGVSIGSLYQYFPNKDALLVALAEHYLTQSAQQVAQVFARAGEHRLPLSALLADLVECVAALHTDRPRLHRLLFDQAPRTPDLVTRFRQAEQQIAQALARELRRVGAGGPDPELNALLAVQGIEAHLHGALLDVPAGHDTTGHVRAVVRLWQHALSAPCDPSTPCGRTAR